MSSRSETPKKARAPVLSMTGAGIAKGPSELGQLAVEVRSVNGRSLSIKLRTSPECQGCEADLESQIRRRLKRGSVTATFELVAPAAPTGGVVDAPLAALALAEVKALATQLGLEPNVSIAQLLLVPGVVRQTQLARVRTSWGLPEDAVRLVHTAIDALLQHRRQEGESAVLAMTGELDALDAGLVEVRARVPAIAAEHREKLLKRINEYLDERGLTLEPRDVLKEVAIFADKIDVSEELQRCATHVVRARELLGNGGEVGRALEFLLQEILREVNTLGSKSPDVAVAHVVVAMKSAVEKLKEQAQNLE